MARYSTVLLRAVVCQVPRRIVNQAVLPVVCKRAILVGVTAERAAPADAIRHVPVLVIAVGMRERAVGDGKG